ncbi:hypothetical protein [Candidatus Harpocratesius sp.]
MNEFGLLTHLLSDTQIINSDISDNIISIGSTEDQLIKSLGLSGKYAKIQLIQLLNSYAQAIRVFGLRVKKNQLNQRWFLAKSPEILESIGSNPFQNKPRLGATLMVIITSIMISKSPIDKARILELRKKQSIEEDLKALAKMNFIIISKSKISLHPNLGYYLDFSNFFSAVEHLSLKFDNQKSSSS